MRFLDSAVMLGRICDLGSQHAPSFRLSEAWTNSFTRGSPASPTATTTLVARQRSPAHPNPEPMIAATVDFISLSGRTTEWFLAPPRACTRFPLLAEVW